MPSDRSSPPPPLAAAAATAAAGGGGRARSSPGLTPTGSGSSTPRSGVFSPGPLGPSGITWSTAKEKSDQVRGYPSFSTRNIGFFSRQKRNLTASLPRFQLNDADHYYLDKDELESGDAGSWWPFGRRSGRNGRRFLRSAAFRRWSKFLVPMLIVWIWYLLFWTSIIQSYRRSSWGGGRKFVIILASNIEGGVMEWKGAREWAIERNSIWNKKKYTERWGYDLELVNMLAKKRYSHEWREGWEKVDAIRDTIRKYPDAEWFWWLDLDTWIMEYEHSLQDHIFNDLASNTYRDINVYNPMNISHPLTDLYLDALDRSPSGDQDPSSINMILSQDCSGFNLGSFFLRRSLWTDRLLDALWDPAMYELKHIEWEQKEQSALQHMYTTQPWIRSNVAFIPQRQINSFPLGACGDEFDERFHYPENGRDFVVNMAGCQFGRDCWGEIYTYRERSNWLNRTRWERLKDGLNGVFNRLFRKKEQQQEEQQQEEGEGEQQPLQNRQ